jgi:pimeloyl-ACP methyl ester carboxylesterase
MPDYRSLLVTVVLGVLLAAAAAGSAAPAGRVTTRTARAPDGLRIAYDVRGRGDVAVVFVHCWACSRAFWREQADAFAARYRVVTVDLGGHGESGRDRTRWSITGLADDVIATVDALALDRVILVGHSMGGTVSLEAARRLGRRVLGVVLVDAIHDVRRRRSAEVAGADAAKLLSNFAGYFADLSALFQSGTDPAIRHWVERQAQAADPRVAIALKLDTPSIDPVALFEGAGVPIRAIDAASADEPTAIAANRRHADYDAIVLDRAGHFLPLEAPRAFNAALARWLTALAAR